MIAEKELERLLSKILPTSSFAGKVYAVGGYVRDELVGTDAFDLDVVVEMPYGAQRFSQYLVDLFGEDNIKGPVPLSLNYPVWRLSFIDDIEWGGEIYHVKGAMLDLTDTQDIKENGLTQFGLLSDDYRRRDFTVNMVFKDLTSGKFLDPSGLGLKDLESGTLRTLPSHNPMVDFSEAPKKILRAIRFALKYKWGLDPSVETAIRYSASNLLEADVNAVKHELRKMREDGTLIDAIGLMKDLGVWTYVVKLLKMDMEKSDEHE